MAIWYEYSQQNILNNSFVNLCLRLFFYCLIGLYLTEVSIASINVRNSYFIFIQFCCNPRSSITAICGFRSNLLLCLANQGKEHS